MSAQDLNEGRKALFKLAGRYGHEFGDYLEDTARMLSTDTKNGREILNHLEVNALQTITDLGIHVSMYESFGMVITELLWKGRVTIASTVGGIPQQYPQDKQQLLLMVLDEAYKEKLRHIYDSYKSGNCGDDMLLGFLDGLQDPSEGLAEKMLWFFSLGQTQREMLQQELNGYIRERYLILNCVLQYLQLVEENINFPVPQNRLKIGLGGAIILPSFLSGVNFDQGVLLSPDTLSMVIVCITAVMVIALAAIWFYIYRREQGDAAAISQKTRRRIFEKIERFSSPERLLNSSLLDVYAPAIDPGIRAVVVYDKQAGEVDLFVVDACTSEIVAVAPVDMRKRTLSVNGDTLTLVRGQGYLRRGIALLLLSRHIDEWVSSFKRSGFANRMYGWFERDGRFSVRREGVRKFIRRSGDNGPVLPLAGVHGTLADLIKEQHFLATIDYRQPRFYRRGYESSAPRRIAKIKNGRLNIASGWKNSPIAKRLELASNRTSQGPPIKYAEVYLTPNISNEPSSGRKYLGETIPLSKPGTYRINLYPVLNESNEALKELFYTPRSFNADTFAELVCMDEFLHAQGQDQGHRQLKELFARDLAYPGAFHKVTDKVNENDLYISAEGTEIIGAEGSLDERIADTLKSLQDPGGLSSNLEPPVQALPAIAELLVSSPSEEVRKRVEKVLSMMEIPPYYKEDFEKFIFDFIFLRSETTGEGISRVSEVWSAGEKDVLSSRMPTLMRILSDDKILARFLFILSLLRIIYRFSEADNKPEFAIEYAQRTGTQFRLGELYLLPVSESFRRHIIYVEDQEGRFLLEIKMPGQLECKAEIVPLHFTIPEELWKKYPQDPGVPKPLFFIRLQGEFSLYEKSIDYKKDTLNIVGFEYQERKRYYVLSEQVVEKVARSCAKTLSELEEDMVIDGLVRIIRIHFLGYQGNIDGGLDMHVENIALLTSGSLILVGDFGASQYLGKGNISLAARQAETQNLMNLHYPVSDAVLLGVVRRILSEAGTKEEGAGLAKEAISEFDYEDRSFPQLLEALELIAQGKSPDPHSAIFSYPRYRKVLDEVALSGAAVKKATSRQVMPAVKVIEFMCGQGDYSLAYKQLHPEAVVYAVDFDEIKIAFLKQRAAEENIEIHSFTGDVTRTNLPAEEFDLVVIKYPQPVDDEMQFSFVINEALRLLKNGGRLSILTENKERCHIITKIVEQRGFAVRYSSIYKDEVFRKIGFNFPGYLLEIEKTSFIPAVPPAREWLETQLAGVEAGHAEPVIRAYKHITENLLLGPQSTVISVGAGPVLSIATHPGSIPWEELFYFGIGATVYLYEPDQELNARWQKAAGEWSERVALSAQSGKAGDLLVVPAPEARFQNAGVQPHCADAVVMSGVLSDYEDISFAERMAVFSKALQILKSGGYLILGGYSDSSVIRECEEREETLLFIQRINSLGYNYEVIDEGRSAPDIRVPKWWVTLKISAKNNLYARGQQQNCLDRYLRKQGRADLADKLIHELDPQDIIILPDNNTPAYRVSSVNNILGVEAEGIFLEESVIEKRIGGQIHHIYHVSDKGTIALTSIPDDQNGWVAGNKPKIVNILVKLILVLIIIVIIGNIKFVSLTSDHNQAGQTATENVEAVDTRSREEIIYQKIILDPQAALQMEISRDELVSLYMALTDGKATWIDQSKISLVKQFCLLRFGQLDDEPNVYLISGLHDGDQDVRTMAGVLLNRGNDYAGSVSIASLSGLGFTQGGQLQQEAIFSLKGATSENVTEFLLRGLEGGSPYDIRYAAAWTLGDRVNLPEVEGALLNSFRSDPDITVRQQAVLSLGGTNNPQTRDILISTLNDPNPLIKQSAILAVTPWAEVKTMESIIPFLNDPDLGVRQAAISSLGSRLSDFPQNLNLLIPKLADPDAGVRSTAVTILGPGINKFPELKQPFMDIATDISQPVEVRQGAILSLSRIDAPEVQSLLTGSLTDANWQVRYSAALGLANFKDPAIPKLLEPLTRDSEWQVREAAVVTLGNFNQPQIIDYLKPLLDDDAWQVRLATVDSFGKFNDPQIIDPLVSKLQDPVWQIRQSAALGLGGFTDPQIPQQLWPLTQDSQWQVRQSAALSLGSFDQPRSIDYLKPLIDDNWAGVRVAAVNSLGNFTDPQVPQLLSSLSQNSNWEVRQAAVTALGNFNQPQTLDYFKPFLEDHRWEVRQSAAMSLGNFNQPQTIDYLKPLLDDSQWQVRLTTVDSFRDFNSPQIIDYLAPKLSDPVWQVRQETALSLGGRLQTYPRLVDPFINTMKRETDPFTRYIFASALRTVPTDPQVMQESAFIQASLIPGLRIEGWEIERPETGIEIGYTPIFWPFFHTFVNVTYQGDSKIISFDSIEKPLGLLFPQSEGRYLNKLNDDKPIIYHTLTIDPVETKRLYDLADTFYQMDDFYNIANDQNFGKNCYGGVDFVLQSIGISKGASDSPLNPLRPNYFSRVISMPYSDPYYLYSFNMQQTVFFPSPEIRTIETNSWTNYNTIQQPAFVPSYNLSSNFQSPDFNTWDGNSFQSLPNTYTFPGSSYLPNNNWNVPTFQYVAPPVFNYTPPVYNPPPSYNNWP